MGQGERHDKLPHSARASDAVALDRVPWPHRARVTIQHPDRRRAQRSSRPPVGNRTDVDRIRDIPIGQVAADLGFRLDSRGRGLCRLPGHDDTRPSFALRPRWNGFVCYPCRKHGSVIDLTMLMEGLDFLRACRWLGERYLGERYADGAAPRRSNSASAPTAVANPELYSWLLDQSPLGDGGRAYLSARGFSAATLAAFRIGQVADRPALLRAARREFGEDRLRRAGLVRDGRRGPDLVFPSHYLLFPFLFDGAVSYIQARRADGAPAYRWLCPGGMLAPAFNSDILSQGHATVMICEGVTDTLSAHELGRPAIGLTGANARLDPETIARLRGHNVVLLGDSDKAGRGFARDIVRLLSAHGITAIARSLPGGANDLNDLLRQQRGLA